jgi:hypothetical protein
MTKHKSVIAVLLSVMIVFTFMPTMAFAADESSDAVLKGAYVVTDDTTEPIVYDSFADALNATNNAANWEKHAVITLNEDATLAFDPDDDYPDTFIIPMTINLNGHKLSGAPADGLIEGSIYCAKNVKVGGAVSQLLINLHDGPTVYTWTEDTTVKEVPSTGRWVVSAKTVTCDACETIDPQPIVDGDVTRTNVSGWSGGNSRQTRTANAARYVTTYDPENDQYVCKYETGEGTQTRTRQYVFPSGWTNWEYGDWTYNWTESSEVATKAANTPDKPYVLNKSVKFVVVNDKIQHKDGLPVVTSKVKEVASGAVVDGAVKLTAVSNEDLAKITDLEVYDKEDKITAKRNQDATCTEPGAVVYKAEVSDPEGNIVETKYLRDDEATPKSGHVKGAFKGYKLLEKAVADGATSDAEAAKAGKDAGKSVVKVSSETDESGVTTYFYWYYDDIVEVAGTKGGSVNANVNLNKEGHKYLEADGSFTFMPVYYCNFEDVNEIEDAAVTVSPLPDATTAAEAKDGKHSKCTRWYYANKAFTYTFGTGVAQNTFTCTLLFSDTPKTPAYESHVSDGTYYKVTKDPTCEEEGTADVKCAICYDPTDPDKYVQVKVAKLADTFGAYSGEGTPGIGNFKIAGKTLTGTKHKITLNANKTEAVVAPTCTEPGGTFKYCTGKNNIHGELEVPHWVLQGEPVPATGHKLAVVVEGKWSNLDYNVVEGKDYSYEAKVVCSNPACDAVDEQGEPTSVFEITYHSIEHADTLTDKYSAIDIVKEDKSKDCMTVAKTTYTVKGVTDRTGAAVTESKSDDLNNKATRGDHAFEVVSYNWSKDYESATVTVKCKNDKTKCLLKGEETTELAEVSKSTAANGLTTFIATYGNGTESKSAYTFTDAKAEFNEAEVTDANLIKGVDGASAKAPKVTVTINGTVIDENEYDVTWYVDGDASKSARTIYAKVTWIEENSPQVGETSVFTKEMNVAAKKTFDFPKVVVKANDEEVPAISTRGYDPTVSNTVEATEKDATVKYAVVNKAVKTQEEIDALDYNLDTVEGIKAVGTYYVYAQLKGEGYTTYSALVAVITINKMSVKASIDNFSMKQGETPVYSVVFTDAEGKVVNVDPSEYKVTTVGGQELTDLIPGDYKLLVTSENYKVDTAFEEGRVGTVTVLTKEGKTAEQDAADIAKAADYALADANALVKSKYTTASYKKVVAAKDALKAAILNGTTQDVKEATATLEKAVKNVKTKKTNPMTVKTKTVKAKTNKTVTKKTGLIVKKAKGTKTYTKVSGNSKITVNSKTGKFTVKKGLKAGTYRVKVKVRAAGNGTYKAKTVKKTVKVKVS